MQALEEAVRERNFYEEKHQLLAHNWKRERPSFPEASQTGLCFPVIKEWPPPPMCHFENILSVLCLAHQQSKSCSHRTKKAAVCQQLLTPGCINTCTVNNNLLQDAILVEPWGLKKYLIGNLPKPISSNVFWQIESTQFSLLLYFLRRSKARNKKACPN